MSTTLYEGKKYALTRYAGKKQVMYQITQDFDLDKDIARVQFVQLSEQDIRRILQLIEKENEEKVKRFWGKAYE